MNAIYLRANKQRSTFRLHGLRDHADWDGDELKTTTIVWKIRKFLRITFSLAHEPEEQRKAPRKPRESHVSFPFRKPSFTISPPGRRNRKCATSSSPHQLVPALPFPSLTPRVHLPTTSATAPLLSLNLTPIKLPVWVGWEGSQG